MLLGYLIWKKDRIRLQIIEKLLKADLISTVFFVAGINIWMRIVFDPANNIFTNVVMYANFAITWPAPFVVGVIIFALITEFLKWFGKKICFCRRRSVTTSLVLTKIEFDPEMYTH